MRLGDSVPFFLFALAMVAMSRKPGWMRKAALGMLGYAVFADLLLIGWAAYTHVGGVQLLLAGAVMASRWGSILTLTLILPAPSRPLNGARPSRAIVQAPGTRHARMGQLLFSHRTYTTVIEPVLSDLQHEYFEALAEHDSIKAVCTRCRGYGSFWLTVVAQIPYSVKATILGLLAHLVR